MYMVGHDDQKPDEPFLLPLVDAGRLKDGRGCGEQGISGAILRADRHKEHGDTIPPDSSGGSRMAEGNTRGERVLGIVHGGIIQESWFVRKAIYCGRARPPGAPPHANAGVPVHTRRIPEP